MIIELQSEYRRYWVRWAKFKPSTCTFPLFTKRMDSDPKYKLMVDTYIQTNRTEAQRQQKLEGQLYYG